MSSKKVRVEVAGAMYTCKLHPASGVGSIFRNGEFFMTLPLEGRNKRELILASITEELALVQHSEWGGV